MYYGYDEPAAPQPQEQPPGSSWFVDAADPDDTEDDG